MEKEMDSGLISFLINAVFFKINQPFNETNGYY